MPTYNVYITGVCRIVADDETEAIAAFSRDQDNYGMLDDFDVIEVSEYNGHLIPDGACDV